MEVRYELKSIDLGYLRKLFAPYKDDPDIIDCYDVNPEQAKALEAYIIDGDLNFDEHFFELRCHQAPGWDWSEGYPRKIETDESK